MDITSDEACAAAIARVGALDRDLARIEAGKADQVARAAAAAEARARPLQDERAALAADVCAYAAAHRGRLTDGGKRQSAPFATGEVKWRRGRASVEVDPTLLDKLIARLKDLKLNRWLRVKTELDKTAIAKEVALIKEHRLKGLRLVPGGESMTIEPLAAELAERLPDAA